VGGKVPLFWNCLHKRRHLGQCLDSEDIARTIVLLLASDVIVFFFSFQCDPIIITSLSLYIFTVFILKHAVVINVSIKKKVERPD
jgi:hypothetical protein